MHSSTLSISCAYYIKRIKCTIEFLWDLSNYDEMSCSYFAKYSSFEMSIYTNKYFLYKSSIIFLESYNLLLGGTFIFFSLHES